VASGTTTLNNTGSSLDALTGNNNFVLQGGTFTVNGGGKILNLGTGSVTNSGTTGLNAFNGGMQFNGAISGTGTLSWFGGGSFVLGGSNTFSGTVNAAVNGGSLLLSNVNALQSATLNKGTNHNVRFALAGSNTYNLGGLTGAGSIALSNGNSLNVNATGNNSSTYSGALSDSGSLTKSGNGTLTLSGANTHSGGTTLSAGRLNINNASALGTGTFTLGNGASFDNTSGGAISNENNNAITLGGTNTFAGSSALDLGTGNVTLSGNSSLDITASSLALRGAISGSASLTKSGTGTLTLSGANTHSGGTTLSAGRLNINNASALGSGTFSLANGASFDNTSGGAISNANNNAIVLGATNTFVGTSSMDLGTGSTTFAGNTRVNVSGNNLTLSGNLSGSAAFNKDGIGTLTLAGSNSMTSFTVIDYGILNLANINALANAQLYLYGSSSNKMVTFGLAGANTYNIGALSGTSTGILTLGGNSVSVGGNNISTTYSGIIEGAGGLTKSGNGTLTLAGANTHSGGTTLSAGRLNINNASALGSGTFSLANGASFDNTSGGAISNANNNAITLGGTNTFDGSSSLDLGAGNVTLTSATRLYVNANSLTLGGNISGSAELNKDAGGTLTLAGSNSMTSITVVDYGILNLANINALANAELHLYDTGANKAVTFGLSGANNYNIGALSGISSGTLTLGGNSVNVGGNNASTTYSGIIEGSGDVTKSGNGILTLSGANTYSGTTTVSGGTLNLANATGAALGSTSSLSVLSGATLLVSAANQVADTAAVTLSGGTITRASGVAEVFGALDLTANSFLDFGSGTGGQLKFGIYEGGTAPSALLTVNNFFQGNSLVFGSDISSYIASSSSGPYTGTYFSFDQGFTTSGWDGSTFTITAIPEPSTVVAAVGLLALMAWPSRRRLMLDTMSSILGLRRPARDRLVK